MLETMTKTSTMPEIGASATRATLAFVLILLAAGPASAQVSRSAGPTLADVKWTLATDDGSATRSPAADSGDEGPERLAGIDLSFARLDAILRCRRKRAAVSGRSGRA